VSSTRRETGRESGEEVDDECEVKTKGCTGGGYLRRKTDGKRDRQKSDAYYGVMGDMNG
jgi:hypothetical protein